MLINILIWIGKILILFSVSLHALNKHIFAHLVWILAEIVWIGSNYLSEQYDLIFVNGFFILINYLGVGGRSKNDWNRNFFWFIKTKRAINKAIEEYKNQEFPEKH